MNYNMYSNNTNDQIDPNYIYPRPYIDPMMYMNPYMMNGAQYVGYQMNPTMSGYTTYSNTYAENPSNPDLSQIDNGAVYPTIEDYSYPDIEAFSSNIPNMNMQGMPNMNMQCTPNTNMPNMNMNGMGMPGMNMPNTPPMQGVPNLMYPGMFPNMYMMPNMMYPGIFPNMYMMPNMMYPGMFPGMPQINMEEFDEEEM